MRVIRVGMVLALSALAGCGSDTGPVGGDDSGDPADAGAVDDPDAARPPPDAAPEPDAAAPLPEPEARYHTWEEVEDFVQAVADRRPGHVELQVVGTSGEGRSVYALKFSDNVGVDEDEPEILINFSIHGDEIITVESALALVHMLGERYHTDARVAALVDDLEIYVVPVVSPDSFDARIRWVQGIDPNRDFPHADDPDHVSIDVVQVGRDLFESHDFVGTLDYHASGELILLPYAASFSQPPNFGELEAIGLIMAEVADYVAVQISDYFGREIAGGSVDYYHWLSEGVTLAVELTTSKAPPTSAIPIVAADAVEMALRFLEQF